MLTLFIQCWFLVGVVLVFWRESYMLRTLRTDYRAPFGFLCWFIVAMAEVVIWPLTNLAKIASAKKD